MARILVTDGEQRSSLAVVRSLGRAGHHVVVCARDPRALAAASRHCGAFRQTPSPTDDPSRYGAVLEWLVRCEEIDVLVPTTDVSALFALELRETGCRATVPFPTPETYHAITDKLRVREVAREVGVPLPRQHVVEHPFACTESAVAFARGVGFPVILKPSRSVVRDLAGVRHFTVRVVASPHELRDGLRALDPSAYPVLVQERIVGDGFGAFLLMREGRTLARFAHRRIRERPPTGGMSTYREGVRRKDLEEYGERLLSHVGWTGVAMVELKEDRATGTPYLMEVNGRFWGSLQLAIDAGVDFPELLVRSALGEDVCPVTTYRKGLRSRWLMGDIDYLIWMLRAPRGYRRVHPELPGRLEAMARLLVPWRPGDRFEVLRLADPRPFFREAASLARSLIARVRRRGVPWRRAHPPRTARSARRSPESLPATSPRGH